MRSTLIVVSASLVYIFHVTARSIHILPRKSLHLDRGYQPSSIQDVSLPHDSQSERNVPAPTKHEQHVDFSRSLSQSSSLRVKKVVARRFGFGIGLGLMKRKSVLGLGSLGSGKDKDVDYADYAQVLLQLYIYRDDIAKNCDNLGSYSNQSATPSFIPSSDFQKSAVAELIVLQTSTADFSTSLHKLGGQKGLAHYDRNNELEHLLKDIVDSLKYGMNSVVDLLYQVPLLGPVLGPVMYDVKCVLDDVLNATENLSDLAIYNLHLNSTIAVLNPLIRTTMHSTCSVINLDGLCVGF